MTAENEFIKKLETFLDQVFNDYSKKRISLYLQEYKDKIPPIIINKTKKEIVRTDVFESRRIIGNKFAVTNDELMNDAIEMCKKYDVDIKDFMDRKHKKARTKVVELRKKFCQDSYEKYICNNDTLSKFFNIHYSTISFYLYGKKYIPKSEATIKNVKNKQ